MLEALMSACWRYKSEEFSRHIHVAAFDILDAFVTVEIEAAPTGGTWQHIVSIPTQRNNFISWWDLGNIDPTLFADKRPANYQAKPDLIVEDDLWEITKAFREVKTEERVFHKFLQVEHSPSCSEDKISWSFFHFKNNQHQDLYLPDRDGVIQLS